jgi:hypothetical protein
MTHVKNLVITGGAIARLAWAGARTWLLIGFKTTSILRFRPLQNGISGGPTKFEGK